MTRASSERLLRTLIAVWVRRLNARRALIVTTAITLAVEEWLKRMGAATVRLEAPLEGSAQRVDVLGEWRDGRRLYVEIDQTPKAGSHRKLSDLRKAGHRVVWVRWDKAHLGPAEVGLVPCVWVSGVARALMAKRAYSGYAKGVAGELASEAARVIHFDDSW